MFITHWVSDTHILLALDFEGPFVNDFLGSSHEISTTTALSTQEPVTKLQRSFLSPLDTNSPPGSSHCLALAFCFGLFPLLKVSL